MRRLKKDGEKMVSEDGPRELVRRLKKDGEKMVSEDGPRELVRRLKDGEKVVSEDGQWRWSERAGEVAEEGWREDGQ